MTRKVSFLAAAGLFLILALVAIGIFANQPILQSFVPGRVGMKPITATLLGLFAAGMLAGGRNKRGLALAAGGILAGFGAVAFCEQLLGADFGTGRLFGADRMMVETLMPGRMAPPTAIAFVALGVLLLALPHSGPRAVRVRLAASAVVFLIGLVVLVGFAYRAQEMRGGAGATPMALPTALAFVLAALAGAMWGREDQWPWCLLQGEGTTARVSRTLIPTIFVIPLVAGSLRLAGETMGWFGRELGTAIVVIFHIVALMSVLVWALSRLQRGETIQREHESMMRRVLSAQQSIDEIEGSSDSIMGRAVELISAVLEGEGGLLAMEQGRSVGYRGAGGIAAPLNGLDSPHDQSLAQPALLSDEVLLIADAANDPQVEPAVQKVAGNRSVVVAPFGFSHVGTAKGAIAIFGPAGSFDARSMDALRLMSVAIPAALLRAERRQQEEAVVAEQLAEIGLLQRRFMAFMENLPAAAFTKDKDGRYLDANDAMIRSSRKTLAELLGRTDAELFSAESAELLRKETSRVVSEGLSVQTDLHFTEFQQSRWWRMIHFPITGTADIIIGGLAFDITQLVEAEQRVAEMNTNLEETVRERTDELQRANRELEGFSYSVSHDLRAPIRAIDGYARMIDEDYAALLGSEGQRYLAVIRSETLRMGSLIDDLLAFSQVGRKSLIPVPLDLGGMSREIIEDLRRVYPDRPIDLRVGDLPPASGDRVTMRQVLVNLLSNAVKYSGDKKAGPIVIEVSGRSEGRENIYAIRDHGVGFDMRYVDKLFGVFQRLHDSNEFEGTGVGLAIVERIIARHEGRVWAEGRVGEGATFSFALPLPAAQGAETVPEPLRNTA